MYIIQEQWGHWGVETKIEGMWIVWTHTVLIHLCTYEEHYTLFTRTSSELLLKRTLPSYSFQWFLASKSWYERVSLRLGYGGVDELNSETLSPKLWALTFLNRLSSHHSDFPHVLEKGVGKPRTLVERRGTLEGNDGFLTNLAPTHVWNFYLGFGMTRASTNVLQ